MNLDLIQASKKHVTVLENLMQFYTYDFSEYLDIDVESNASFAAYPDLDSYWREYNKIPYVIKRGDKYVGFALVRFIQSEKGSYFSMAEFFVLKKYRKTGVGRYVAFQLFDLYKGKWEIFQRDGNKPAQQFWKKIIHEYTKGQFNERSEEGRLVQGFESN